MPESSHVFDPFEIQLARVKAERDRLRSALVAVVGEDDPKTLEAMKLAMPPENELSRASLAAIEALLEIRPK